MAHPNWVGVTRGSPCPICARPDWCTVTRDGGTVICHRVESAKSHRGGGWVHVLSTPARGPNGKGSGSAPRRARPVEPEPAQDWQAEAERYAAAMTEHHRETLAKRLGLPVETLAALPLIGFRAESSARKKYVYTIPECDHTGKVIGIATRVEWALDHRGNKPKSEKQQVPGGGKRGLTLPTGFRERAACQGHLYVVEGQTDVIAGIAAGLSVIGRPSNSGGRAHLAQLAATMPDVRFVIVGENDPPKEDGSIPGKACESVARLLAEEIGRPVAYVYPPAGAKDVKDWLTADERIEREWDDLGAELRAHLIATAVECHPEPPVTFADISLAPEVIPPSVDSPEEPATDPGARGRYSVGPSSDTEYRPRASPDGTTGWESLLADLSAVKRWCPSSFRQAEIGVVRNPKTNGTVRVMRYWCARNSCPCCSEVKKIANITRACPVIASATAPVRVWKGRGKSALLEHLRRLAAKAKVAPAQKVSVQQRRDGEYLVVTVGGPDSDRMTVIAPEDAADMVARAIAGIEVVHSSRDDRFQPVSFSADWPDEKRAAAKRAKEELRASRIASGEPPDGPEFYRAFKNSTGRPARVTMESAEIAEHMRAMGFEAVVTHDDGKSAGAVVQGKCLSFERVCRLLDIITAPVSPSAPDDLPRSRPPTLADLDDD